jgi:hypothetical protein
VNVREGFDKNLCDYEPTIPQFFHYLNRNAACCSSMCWRSIWRAGRACMRRRGRSSKARHPGNGLRRDATATFWRQARS